MVYLVGTRMDENVERGALGGGRFNTSVLELDSGFEKRNINWSIPRAEFDVGYGLMTKFQEDPSSIVVDVDQLVHFFYTVQGRAHSFRFRDWADFEIGYENGVVIARQFLAFANGSQTDFPLHKRYSFGSTTYDRFGLTKIVNNIKVELYDEGVEVDQGAAGDEYVLDADRGLFKFNTAPLATGGSGPGGNHLIECRCEFDLHVRLDTDDLNISMEMFAAGSWPNIPIVELRGNGID